MRFLQSVCKMPIRAYYKRKDRKNFLATAIYPVKTSKIDKETA